jgi:hypothetical protein
VLLALLIAVIKRNRAAARLAIATREADAAAPDRVPAITRPTTARRTVNW